MFSKSKSVSLLVISGLTFLLSLWVFVFFLTSNFTTNESALALSYNADQVIVAVNNRRVKENLLPLTKNPKLDKAALDKANHMAEFGYFSHVHKESGKRWSDFIKENGYEYTIAGENLANGFYSVEEMIEAWMDSPTHRENILNKGVEETGVGISFGELDGVSTIFVVQVFGKV